MIESEEKRKKIIDKLERWSKNCKVDHLLRDHDIPGLANWILEEFYHIHLCCGHLVREFNEGVDLEMADYSDGEKATSSGIYCKECAEWFLKNDKSCRKI